MSNDFKMFISRHVLVLNRLNYTGLMDLSMVFHMISHFHFVCRACQECVYLTCVSTFPTPRLTTSCSHGCNIARPAATARSTTLARTTSSGISNRWPIPPTTAISMLTCSSASYNKTTSSSTTKWYSTTASYGGWNCRN